MDAVSDLLPAGGSRIDKKAILQSLLMHQMLQHVLSHGGTADVAVAHEQHSNHLLILLDRDPKSLFPGNDRIIIATGP